MGVHKATIAVSVADAGRGEVRYNGAIANRSEAIGKLVRQLRKVVAYTLGVTPQTVTNWRTRFLKQRLDGLLDALRPAW